MIADKLSELYCEAFGTAPESVVLLPAAGSNRRYYRLDGAVRAVGTYGDDVKENHSFLEMCRCFSDVGLSVPKLYAVSSDESCYLQENLGSMSLFDFIKPGREHGEWSQEIVAMLERVIKMLPDMQWLGGRSLDFEVCHPVKEMTRESVMWDLNYFKYCFLKSVGVTIDEVALERDFNKLADNILAESNCGDVFMYRDFQSRNVMLVSDTDGLRPVFIDFQGGRRGSYLYDVVSFLWQAKAHIPNHLREHLLNVYIESASRYISINVRELHRSLRHMLLFRQLQVLGAYGFRGYTERKPHFLQSINDAIKNISELIATPFADYPYLSRILDELVAMPRFSTGQELGGLVVKVASFGYNRSGIPVDMSGNGGGYVFDCRGLPNPGRYEQYKRITGRDAQVMEFLEREPAVKRFVDSAICMVDTSIETYLERGFSSLMVSFGCTGGQHRSVYCAEQLVSHLRQRYPSVTVQLNHCEQSISEIYHGK